MRKVICLLNVPLDLWHEGDIDEMFQRTRQTNSPALSLLNVVPETFLEAMQDSELQRALIAADGLLPQHALISTATEQLCGREVPVFTNETLWSVLGRYRDSSPLRLLFLTLDQQYDAELKESVQQRLPPGTMAEFQQIPARLYDEESQKELLKKIHGFPPHVLLLAVPTEMAAKWLALYQTRLRSCLCWGIRHPKHWWKTGEQADGSRRTLARSWEEMFADYRKPFEKAVEAQLSWLEALRRQASSDVTVDTLQPGKTPSCMPAEFTAAVLDRIDSSLLDQARSGGAMMLDFSAVRIMDSSGAGFLLKLQKELGRMQGELILAEVGENIHRTLKLMQIDQHLKFAPTVEAAQKMIAETSALQRLVARYDSSKNQGLIFWKGDLTAASAASYVEGSMRYIQVEMEQHPSAEFVLDLSGITLIDSSGLGALVKLRKWAINKNVWLAFRQPSANLRRAAQLSHLMGVIFGGE